jgi:hypothetical protein
MERQLAFIKANLNSLTKELEYLHEKGAMLEDLLTLVKETSQ